ncbi:MAG: class I SAM-dependent methyltransferase [Chloroflexi bacterium]|nr:class I SAM-dependent methyltransferase [Chloroflexota bacterium]
MIESLLEPTYDRALDARLDSYDAYIEYQQHEARRALPFLAKYFNPRAARVLEIGTGTGGKGIAYARAGMRVSAFDLDRAALARAQIAARKLDAPIDFLSTDAARLPYPNNFFDAVLLDSVIEHVSDPARVLQESWRVLKPGGITFVVFPPFFGPLSGHIDDYILLPLFHLLPDAIVRRALEARPRARGLLTPQYAYAVYKSLNRLTIGKFKRAARRAGFRFDYWRVRPFLTHPGTRFAVGLLAALRQRGKNLRAVLSRARREFSAGTFFLFLLLCALAPLVFVPILQEIAAGGCKSILRKAEKENG